MVDPKRKAIYVSTGNAFSDPDTGRSDAVIAMEMDTGKILWVRQAQPRTYGTRDVPREIRQPALVFRRSLC